MLTGWKEKNKGTDLQAAEKRAGNYTLNVRSPWYRPAVSGWTWAAGRFGDDYESATGYPTEEEAKQAAEIFLIEQIILPAAAAVRESLPEINDLLRQIKFPTVQSNL